jgi:hypothetical protein
MPPLWSIVQREAGPCAESAKEQTRKTMSFIKFGLGKLTVSLSGSSALESARRRGPRETQNDSAFATQNISLSRPGVKFKYDWLTIHIAEWKFGKTSVPLKFVFWDK